MSGILLSKYLFWDENIVQNIANTVRIEIFFFFFGLTSNNFLIECVFLF